MNETRLLDIFRVDQKAVGISDQDEHGTLSPAVLLQVQADADDVSVKPLGWGHDMISCRAYGL